MISSLNCIAINPQWHDEFFLSFPLGLATIVSIIKQLGHNVQVVDFDAERLGDDYKIKLLDRITPKSNIVLLTGMITSYGRILQLSEMVKSIIPDCIVILGGSLATTAPDSVLKKLSVDIFVIGEGDKTIELLLEAIQSETSLRNVSGIKIKEDDDIFLLLILHPQILLKHLGLVMNYSQCIFILIFIRSQGVAFKYILLKDALIRVHIVTESQGIKFDIDWSTKWLRK
ncbi:MAG: cobalamin-dependent protein [Proteobacteria bacterium]|nr:cobalamin-dependent protein [Pseudomonadota bacterium]